MSLILVIEDQAPLRRNLCWLLQAEGYDVIDAPDGEAGLYQIEQRRPDLVLCDILMPKMDGREVLRTIRARPDLSTIPFVFLTARAEREDVRGGMNEGADDYLTKPFSADEVMITVRTQLQKRAAYEAEAETRLGELRAQISQALPHELRTPLTTVIGFTQVLLEDLDHLDAASVREMLQDILAAGRRLERTVVNYDLYARLTILGQDEAARVALRRSHTPDAARIVADAARRLARRHDRAADLVLQLAASPAAVREGDLDKIASEVFDNAFKFSFPGTSVLVTGGLNLDGDLEGRPSFVFRVRDVGSGIPPETVRRLGAFFQPHREAYEQQGSGLGLAIVHQLAHLYGGQLVLTSEPGAGTSVEVHLPAQ